jgi:hypothetical protein
MKEETVITKTTHEAGNEPTVMTTENTIEVPVQTGADIEGEINAAKTRTEKVTIEKKVHKG